MKNTILAISFLFLLAACNSEISLDDALIEIAKETPVTLDNWEIVEKLGEKGFRQYVLFQTKGDTTHIINFDTENQAVSLYYYDIRFSDESYDYYLRMKSDTSYFYKINKLDSATTFIQGEYSFRNRKQKHSSGQREYYRLHKDSLDAVKGNGLPELPEIPTIIDGHDSLVFDESVDK